MLNRPPEELPPQLQSFFGQGPALRQSSAHFDPDDATVERHASNPGLLRGHSRRRFETRRRSSLGISAGLVDVSSAREQSPLAGEAGELTDVELFTCVNATCTDIRLHFAACCDAAAAMVALRRKEHEFFRETLAMCDFELPTAVFEGNNSVENRLFMSFVNEIMLMRPRLLALDALVDQITERLAYSSHFAADRRVPPASAATAVVEVASRVCSAATQTDRTPAVSFDTTPAQPQISIVFSPPESESASTRPPTPSPEPEDLQLGGYIFPAALGSPRSRRSSDAAPPSSRAASSRGPSPISSRLSSPVIRPLPLPRGHRHQPPALPPAAPHRDASLASPAPQVPKSPRFEELSAARSRVVESLSRHGLCPPSARRQSTTAASAPKGAAAAVASEHESADELIPMITNVAAAAKPRGDRKHCLVGAEAAVVSLSDASGGDPASANVVSVGARRQRGSATIEVDVATIEQMLQLADAHAELEHLFAEKCREVEEHRRAAQQFERLAASRESIILQQREMIMQLYGAQRPPL